MAVSATANRCLRMPSQNDFHLFEIEMLWYWYGRVRWCENTAERVYMSRTCIEMQY